MQQIQKREQAEKNKKLEEERRAAMPKEYIGMPEAPLITHLRKKANTNYANRPTDSELDDIETLLKKMDERNKGYIMTEVFKTFMSKLYEDSCDMGKVPIVLTEKELASLISEIKVPSEEERDELTLKNVINAMSKIEWRLLTEGELKVRTDKLYAEVR